MKVLKVILIPILIVVFLAGSVLVVIDGIKDLITQAIGKLIDRLTDTDGMKTFARNRVNDVLDIFKSGKYLLPSSDEYMVVIDEETFSNMRNSLENIINMKASGYEDITIKKMLLIYHTSICTSDTKILINLTEEEYNKFNDEEAANSPYEAKTRKELDIKEEDGISGDYFLVTNGIIHIYLDGDTSKEIRYLSNSTIGTVVNDLRTRSPGMIGGALGTFYGIDKLGTIKLYTSQTNSTNNEMEYDGDKVDEESSKTEKSTIGSGGITFDYTMYTNDYVIPVELLADFLNLTGSTDFIDKFAKLQENSYINLGIYKTSVETTTTLITNYDYNMDFLVSVAENTADGPRLSNKSYSSDTKSMQETNITKNKTYNFQMELFEVDNWFIHLEQKNTLSDITTYEAWNSSGELVKTDSPDTSSLNKVPKPGQDKSEDVAGWATGDVPLLTRLGIRKELEKVKEKIKKEGYEFITLIKTTYNKKNTTQSKLVETVVRDLEAGVPDKTDNTDKFLALLSTASGVYSEEDVKNGKFVAKKSGGKVVKYDDIYDGKTGVGELLENGAETFFQLLEDSLDQDNNDIGSNTAGLVELMKYIMWRYSGIDYGVTDFNSITTFSSQLIGITGGVIGNTPEEKVWYTLINAGYSEIAVAAVMGNIYGESGFNPKAQNSLGAIGLCQWLDRAPKLKEYAASESSTWEDVDIQINFLKTEIDERGDGPAKGHATAQMNTPCYGYSREDWKSAKSIDESTKAFCRVFERCSNDEFTGSINKRINAANGYYKKYHGKKMTAGNIGSYSKDQYYGVYTSSKGITYIGWTQLVDRYSRIPLSGFAGDNLRDSGCHVTSWCILLSGYGATVSPEQLNAMVTNSGSNTAIESAIHKLGVTGSIHQQGISKAKVKQLLKSGKPVIIYGRRAAGFKYAYSQHFITLVDYDESKSRYYVLNPSSNASNKSGWQSEYDIFNGASSMKWLE